MLTTRHYTVFGIIGICVLVFAVQQLGGYEATVEYGAVPAEVLAAWHQLWDGAATTATWWELSTLASCIFLHGDVEHILYNMLFLWVFAVLVGEQLGPWWTIAIFLITGFVGSVTHVVLNGDSMVPMIGASGAVCGFEGVYLGLAMTWRLPPPDVWPLAHPIPPAQLAALGVLGFGFDAYALMNHQVGIAYGAHVGGFLCGLAISGLVTTFTGRDARG